MALFRRKNADTSTVPSEVTDYYQAERRDRLGMAWLLTIATFVITVVLVLALYFGGRWVYRKITNKDDKQQATTQTQDQNPDQNQQGQPAQNQPTPSTPAPSGNTGGQTPANGSNNNPTGGTGQNQPTTQGGQTGTSSTSTNTPSTTQTPTANTPAPQANTVPNTGPGNIVAIFIIATLGGAIFYRTILVRRAK